MAHIKVVNKKKGIVRTSLLQWLGLLLTRKLWNLPICKTSIIRSVTTLLWHTEPVIRYILFVQYTTHNSLYSNCVIYYSRIGAQRDVQSWIFLHHLNHQQTKKRIAILHLTRHRTLIVLQKHGGNTASAKLQHCVIPIIYKISN